MSADLPKRIAVAAVGIPAAFALVYLGGWPLAALIAFLGTVGTREFLNLSRAGGAQPSEIMATAGAVAAPLVTHGLLFGWLEPVGALAVGAAWFFLVLMHTVWSYREGQPAVLSASVTVFGPVYTSLLPSALLWLRHGFPDTTPLVATWIVFFPLAMTWVCDSFAMAGGSMMGGPKFAPTVSPNKTWSGTLSGLVGALLVAWIFSWAVFDRFDLGIPLTVALAGGLAVGTLGQIGDLAESAFKRSVGVKDSGTFFPGHGGVLDRMDSLYWALPVITLVFALTGVMS